MKNDKLQSSMKTIKNTFFLGIVCAASVVSSVAHELEANETVSYTHLTLPTNSLV